MAFKGTASGKNSVTITKGSGSLTYNTEADALDSSVVSGALTKGTWDGNFNAEVKTIDATKASGAITINTENSSLIEIDTGKKNDTVTVKNSVMKTVKTNAGNDVITVENAASGANIDAGAGNDNITLNDAPKATVVLGAGNDTLTNNAADVTKIDGSAGGNNTINLNTTSTNNTAIELGKGKDTLNFAAGVTGYKVTLGAGADLAVFEEGAGATITDVDGKQDVIKLSAVSNITADAINYANGKMTIYGGKGEKKTVQQSETKTAVSSVSDTEAKFEITARLTKITYTATTDASGNTTWSNDSATAQPADVELTVTINASGQVTSITETENSSQVEILTATDSSKTTTYHYYTGISGKGSNSLSLSNGTSTSKDSAGNFYAASIRFSAITAAHDEDNGSGGTTSVAAKVDDAVITWDDPTIDKTVTEIYLEGLSDSKLVKIVDANNNVIFEQTPSAVTGTGEKQTYDITNANTGAKLVLNDKVKTITNTKRTKALSIVADGATSIIAGSGADTISTFATDEAHLEGGKGADVFVVNAGNNLIIDSFVLGTNTKKVDALQFGKDIATVENITTADEVAKGNAVLKFYGLNDDGTKNTSNVANVTVVGAAWDGAASGKEITVLNASGQVSAADTKGYGDIHISVITAADTSATISDDKNKFNSDAGKSSADNNLIDTVTYFTNNKAMTITAGELNVVGGKKADTITGRGTIYALNTHSTVDNSDPVAYYQASDVKVTSSSQLTTTGATSASSTTFDPDALATFLGYNASDIGISLATFDEVKGISSTNAQVYFISSGTKVTQAFMKDQVVTDPSNDNIITGFTGSSALEVGAGTSNSTTNSTLSLSFTNTDDSNLATKGYADESIVSGLSIVVPYRAEGGSTGTAWTTSVALVNVFKGNTDTTYSALNKDTTYSYTSRDTATFSTSDGGTGNDYLISNVRGGAFFGGAGNDTLKIGLESATLSNSVKSHFKGTNDLSNDVIVKGGAGNDTFLIDGLVGNAEINDYSNATATSFSDAKTLKNVKKLQGTDKIVFQYDTYKTKAPSTRVTISSVDTDGLNKSPDPLTLSDGSTVKAAQTYNLHINVAADAFNPNLGTAKLSDGSTITVGGAGAFESNAVSSDTFAHEVTNASGQTETVGIEKLSQFSTSIDINNIVVGDNLSVQYKGINFNQVANLDAKVTANGNYLGLLNPNATSITNAGKGGLLIGGAATTAITGGGKNDTLVAHNADNQVATTLKGGEGSDVFDTREAKANINDYQAGKDKVLVSSFNLATSAILASTVDGDKGTESFGFQLTTLGTTGIASSIQLDYTLDRNTGTLSALMGTNVVATQTVGTDRTSAFSAQSFKFGFGTNTFEVELTEKTIGKGNDVGEYSIVVKNIGTVAQGSALAQSNISTEDGVAYSTITLTNTAIGTIYGAKDANNDDVYYTALDNEDNLDLNSRIERGTVFWGAGDGANYNTGFQLTTSGWVALTATNANLADVPLSTDTVKSGDINGTYFADRVTFVDAQVASKANTAASNKDGVTFSGKDLDYNDTTFIHNGADGSAITFITEDEDPTFNTKTGKYTGTKKTTKQEVRVYNKDASVVAGGASDVINVYNADIDAKVKVVTVGSKAASVNNASFNVATITGGKKADTISSVGRLTDAGGIERVKVATGAGNDVIMADSFVEITDFTAAKAKSGNYASGDIVDFYDAKAYSNTGDYRDGITASDITNLFGDAATQLDDANGQKYHRLSVTFEGQDVVIGGVKLKNMKGKAAAFRVWDDNHSVATTVVATLNNAKEYIETSASNRNINGADHPDKTAIDSTKVTKGATITLSTNIQNVTAGKGVDTIIAGARSATMAGGLGADFFVFGTDAFKNVEGEFEGSHTYKVTDYLGDKIVLGDGVSIKEVKVGGGSMDSVVAGKGAKAHTVTYSDVTLTLSHTPADGNELTDTVILQNVSSDQGYKVGRARQAGVKTYGFFDYDILNPTKKTGDPEYIATIVAADGTDFFDLGGANANTVEAYNSKAITLGGAGSNLAAITSKGKGAISYEGNVGKVHEDETDTPRTLSTGVTFETIAAYTNAIDATTDGSVSSSYTQAAYSLKIDLSKGKYLDRTTGDTNYLGAINNSDTFLIEIGQDGKIMSIKDSDQVTNTNASGDTEVLSGDNLVLTKVDGATTDITDGTYTKAAGAGVDLKANDVTLTFQNPETQKEVTFTLKKLTDSTYSYTPTNATDAVEVDVLSIEDKAEEVTYVTKNSEIVAVTGHAVDVIGQAKANSYVGHGADDTLDFRAGGNNTIRGGSATVSLGAAVTGNDVIFVDNKSDIKVYGYMNTAKKTGGLDKIYLDTVYGSGQITKVETVEGTNDKNYGLKFTFAGTKDDELETQAGGSVTLVDYSNNGNQAVYIGQAAANKKGKLAYSALSQVAYGVSKGKDSDGNDVTNLTVVGSAGNDTIDLNVASFNIQAATGGKGADVFKVRVGAGSAGGTPTIAGFNVGKDVVQFVGTEGNTANGDIVNKTFDLSDYSNKYTYLGGDTATLHYFEDTNDDGVNDITQDVILTGVGTKTSLATTGIRTSVAKGAKAVALSNQQDVILKAKPAVTSYDLSSWNNVTKTFNASKVGKTVALSVTGNKNLTSYTAGKGRDVLYTAIGDDTEKAKQVEYTYQAQAGLEDAIYIKSKTDNVDGNKAPVKLSLASGLSISGYSVEDLNNIVATVVDAKGKAQGTIRLVDDAHDGEVFNYTWAVTTKSNSNKVGGEGADSGVGMLDATFALSVEGGIFDKPTKIYESVLNDVRADYDTATQPAANASDSEKGAWASKQEYEAWLKGFTDIYGTDGTAGKKSFGEAQYKDYLVKFSEKSGDLYYAGGADTEGTIDDSFAIIHTSNTDGSGWQIQSVERVTAPKKEGGDPTITRVTANRAGDFALGAFTLNKSAAIDASTGALKLTTADASVSYITNSANSAQQTKAAETITNYVKQSVALVNGTDETDDSHKVSVADDGASTSDTGTGVDIGAAAEQTGSAITATFSVKTTAKIDGSSSGTFDVPDASATGWTPNDNGTSTKNVQVELKSGKNVTLVYTKAASDAITLSNVLASTGVSNVTYTSGATFKIGDQEFTVPTTGTNAHITWGYNVDEIDSAVSGDLSTKATINVTFNDADDWGNVVGFKVNGAAIPSTNKITLTSSTSGSTDTAEASVTSTTTSGNAGTYTLTVTPKYYTRSFTLDGKTYTINFKTDDFGQNTSDSTKVTANIDTVNDGTDNVIATGITAKSFTIDATTSASAATDVFANTTFNVEADKDKVNWATTINTGKVELDKEYTVTFGTDKFGNSNKTIATITDGTAAGTHDVSSGSFTLVASDGTKSTTINVATGTATTATEQFTWTSTKTVKTVSLGGLNGQSAETYTLQYYIDKLGNSSDTIEGVKDSSDNSTVVTSNAFTLSANGGGGEFTINTSGTDANKVTWNAKIEAQAFNGVGTTYNNTTVDAPASTTNYAQTFKADGYGNRLVSSGTVENLYSSTSAFSSSAIDTTAGGSGGIKSSSGTAVSGFDAATGKFTVAGARTALSTDATFAATDEGKAKDIEYTIASSNVTWTVPNYTTKSTAGTNTTSVTTDKFYQSDIDNVTSDYTAQQKKINDKIATIDWDTLDFATQAPFEERFEDIETTKLFSDFVSSSVNDLSNLVDSKAAVDVASTATETDHKNFLSHILASSNLHTNKK